MQRFTSFDGTRISYHLWGEPDGDLPPVLLHHGFAATARIDWELPGVVETLVGSGRHVVGIDARGHGESDKHHDASRCGELTMARDVSALIDELAVPLVDLVGYSMGAVVALITATREPRVRRLVVGGVGSGVVEVGGLDSRAVRSDAVIEALTTDDPRTITDPLAAGFRQLADATGGDRLALTAQLTASHRGGVALDGITAPTLVIAGDADPFATRPEVLAGAVPGAKLLLVPGDHPGVLREPAFADAIADFVNG
ncbi:alpha/beta fold hydrolase [Umezawaea beigongshangensis]|uniref:alpha/beta fold hydrolase n=1 Tax=Umezawaea beigongshangensis TaxID=2780383 RepID=UPI0018F241A1|nr:alpha/beta fold hydrolase [Umezawaea beigongshangensis]